MTLLTIYIILLRRSKLSANGLNLGKHWLLAMGAKSPSPAPKCSDSLLEGLPLNENLTNVSSACFVLSKKIQQSRSGGVGASMSPLYGLCACPNGVSCQPNGQCLLAAGCLVGLLTFVESLLFYSLSLSRLFFANI